MGIGWNQSIDITPTLNGFFVTVTNTCCNSQSFKCRPITIFIHILTHFLCFLCKFQCRGVRVCCFNPHILRWSNHIKSHLFVLILLDSTCLVAESPLFGFPNDPNLLKPVTLPAPKGGSDLNLLSAEVVADGLASLLSGGSWEVRNDRGACELLGKRWRALLLSKSSISDLRP